MRSIQNQEEENVIPSSDELSYEALDNDNLCKVPDQDCSNDEVFVEHQADSTVPSKENTHSEPDRGDKSENRDVEVEDNDEVKKEIGETVEEEKELKKSEEEDINKTNETSQDEELPNEETPMLEVTPYQSQDNSISKEDEGQPENLASSSRSQTVDPLVKKRVSSSTNKVFNTFSDTQAFVSQSSPRCDYAFEQAVPGQPTIPEKELGHDLSSCLVAPKEHVVTLKQPLQQTNTKNEMVCVSNSGKEFFEKIKVVLRYPLPMISTEWDSFLTLPVEAEHVSKQSQELIVAKFSFIPTGK